jgi:hypothetical protein
VITFTSNYSHSYAILYYNLWILRSIFLVVLLLLVGIDLVHERVVLAVHHVLVGIDRNVVQVHRQQYLLLHNGLGRVVGQLYVEEAGVGLRKRLVLVLLVGQHRLYHEADVVSLILLAVYWQSLLAPTETDYLQPVKLGQLANSLPEELYTARLLSQSS